MSSQGAQPPSLGPGQRRVLDAVVEELARLTAARGPAVVADWQAELTLRSETLGIRPSGAISGTGSCRILRAADGWCALNLARPWDLEALPAVLESPVEGDPWEAVAGWVRGRPAAALVDRARLLGLAASVENQVPPSAPVPLRSARCWGTLRAFEHQALSVVDLSSLWAGPLVARLLAQAGATVLKVEGRGRPDGARAHPAFYEALHPADQETAVIDFGTESGRGELRALLERADVVIEASRPRALAQLGCSATDLPPRDGRVWLGITGYGRTGPPANWIAFGDDAAVAGGLTGRTADGEATFLGDALADPITGLMGAAAVLGALATGGGQLIDLSLAGAAAVVARSGSPGSHAGTGGAAGDG